MKHHNLIQGSPEWHAYRAEHWNASDAPAMLGVSPYKSRDQLLKEYATGLTEQVDAATQRRFDDGHRTEALARKLAESLLGEDLYPVVGSEGRYSASFDGLTMLEDTGFEHKMLNDAIRQALPDPWDPEAIGLDDDGFADAAALPLLYRVQMEQQAMVSGCGRVMFMATKWKGEELVEQRRAWYKPDPELRARIVAGWEQFAIDLANYQPPAAAAPKAVGQAPEQLPALKVEVTGKVLASNLEGFKETALARIRGINRDLKTDQDFADAELAVKFCADVEERLELAKKAVLSQTADIDVVLRTLDDIGAEARATRLALEKDVKARKEELKAERINEARAQLAEHVGELNESLGRTVLPVPLVDFPAVIKGKRSLTAIEEALNTTLANAKIVANTQANTVRTNLVKLADLATGMGALFPDLNQLLLREPDVFEALVRSRLAQHDAEEQARQARERQAEAEASRAHLSPNPFDTLPAAPAAPAANESAPAELPTLKLGDLNKALGGVTVSADFLASLGFVAHEAKGAKLYRPSDFPRICQAIARHVTAAATTALRAA